MPTETFPVRYDECDFYGHLNNTGYLRYLYEATRRLWGGTPPGSGGGRVLNTEIEYLTPLVPGDRVEVEANVGAVAGTLARCHYTLRRQRDGERVASAWADWEGLEVHEGQTVGMESPPLPAPVPELPVPPPGVFTIRLRVPFRDLSPGQQVDPATLMVYVEECGVQVIAAHGWPVSRMLRDGGAIIVGRHTISYGAPAALDDELELSSWVSDVKRASAMRHYRARRVDTGEMVVQVSSLGVWMELATGRPFRIPAHFITDFARNIVSP